MLPRMQAATAAPTPVAGAWPWPATGATWRRPARAWPIATPTSAPPRSAPWPAWASSPRPTSSPPSPTRTRRPAARRRRRPGGPGEGLALGPAPGRHRALADPDPLVVVGAAWFVGERRRRAAVPALAALATGHADTRCREAAVAALGAVGDPDGLDAVLAALDDKPTVRRRATVALAGFDDPRVEPALRRAASRPGLAGAPGGRRAARRAAPRGRPSR